MRIFSSVTYSHLLSWSVLLAITCRIRIDRSAFQFIKSSDTKQFTFEAVLLLAILANFHKSDAAKLNPYLQRLKATQDKDLMRIICWACNFAIDASVTCVHPITAIFDCLKRHISAYQEIWDDSLPTLTTTLGSIITSLRPDRALVLRSTDPSREAFKTQLSITNNRTFDLVLNFLSRPIEASVILLPVFEFIQANGMFVSTLLEDIATEQDMKIKPGRLPPTPFTLLTLSSYLLSHATSASSPRAMAYADLCLKLLLAIAENDEALTLFCQSNPIDIRICRQVRTIRLSQVRSEEFMP